VKAFYGTKLTICTVSSVILNSENMDIILVFIEGQYAVCKFSICNPRQSVTERIHVTE